MTRNEKLNHMLSLTEEVNILTQRIKPQATGYLHTTINTLRERITELKTQLEDKPTRLSGAEGIDGMYTDDEVRGWEEISKDNEPPMSIH
tara:strand:- start:256 stop:525 length:270 start_codon:yes stop_codon:yes gene_type:complete